MRKSNHFIVLAALASLLLLEMAFAREKNQAALNLTETVQVGSAQLKPGNYKLEWQGDGPTVQVRIFQEHKLVATAPGKLIQKPQLGDQDDFVLKTVSGNMKRLDEVDLSKRKEALVFSES